MFKYFYTAYVVFFLFSCKKNEESSKPASPTIPHSDTISRVMKVEKYDLNSYDVWFFIYPHNDESYSKVYLQWSVNEDFSSPNDSALLFDSISSPFEGSRLLPNLHQNTVYYSRVSFLFKNERFYSKIFSWKTDTLIITDFGNWGSQAGLMKQDTTFLYTNAPYKFPGYQNSKVFLGSYLCSVASDQGQVVRFVVPANIPFGKYKLQLQRNGNTSFAGDSALIVNGNWNSDLNSPNYPVIQSAISKGLSSFGTAYSQQKGWVIGGGLLNPIGSEHSGDIYEFDLQNEQWTNLSPANKRYFYEPISYYYNNSIYVISGRQVTNNGNTISSLKRMQRLDLATLTWYDLDSVPYKNTYNLTSFEINNEWYIGMGQRGDSVSLCCGQPLPSKKFYKYNPAINQWTNLADFPGGDQIFPTGFSIGTKGYFFYGYLPTGNQPVPTTFTREFWEYNSLLNSWQQIALPSQGGPPAGEKYQIFTDNGKAYFTAGQKRVVTGTGYDNYPTPAYLEWDPVSNQYQKFAFTGSDILLYLGKKGKKYYFHGDETFYNRTYRLILE